MNKLVVNYDSTIVVNRIVPDRPNESQPNTSSRQHPDIEKDVLTVFVGDDATQHLPRMNIRIIFEEMIKAAIPPFNIR